MGSIFRKTYQTNFKSLTSAAEIYNSREIKDDFIIFFKSGLPMLIDVGVTFQRGRQYRRYDEDPMMRTEEPKILSATSLATTTFSSLSTTFNTPPAFSVGVLHVPNHSYSRSTIFKTPEKKIIIMHTNKTFPIVS